MERYSGEKGRMELDKERLNAYAARVTQANRSELVVIIYEAFLDSVEDGRKYLKEGDLPACRREIERARGFLTELMGSLDFSYEISHYLRRLYVFAYQELCQGIAERDEARFSHATDIVQKLLPAFQKVADQDDSDAVMENTETIYAGLTYGKDSLNESLGVNVNMNRGFQA